MRESGDASWFKALGVTKGFRYFDLGCGDGTTAIPQAKLGARRAGCRLSPATCSRRETGAHQQMGLAIVGFRKGYAVRPARGLAGWTLRSVVTILRDVRAQARSTQGKVRVTPALRRIVLGTVYRGDPTLVFADPKISSAYTPPPPKVLSARCLWGREYNVTGEVVTRDGR